MQVTWNPGMSLEDIEEKIIDNAYRFFNCSEQTAAQSLKISLQVFNEIKMRSLSKKDENDKQIQLNNQKFEQFKIRAQGKSVHGEFPESEHFDMAEDELVTPKRKYVKRPSAN